jgi:hypothetical protein
MKLTIIALIVLFVVSTVVECATLKKSSIRFSTSAHARSHMSARAKSHAHLHSRLHMKTYEKYRLESLLK